MPPVSEHMSANLLTVSAATPVGEAAKEMDERSVGAVLVLADGALEGVFTERDVLRAGDFMTPHPETIEPDETTEHAAVLMIHGGFRHLPIVEGGKVVGILSIRDLMRAVLDDAAPRGV